MLTALTALPAATAGIVTATEADPAISAPINELLARWRSTIADFGDGQRDHSDEEVSAFVEETEGLAHRIAKTPAANLRDLAAKAEVARHELGDALAEAEYVADRVVLSVLDDIQRIAAQAAA